MHPDVAVPLTTHDLRTRHAAPPPAQRRSRSTASTLVQAYFGALCWYVAEGRTPAGDHGAEVGHLPRIRSVARAPQPALAAIPCGAEVAR